MSKPKNVDAFILSHPQWREELGMLRRIMLDMGLDETIKWNFPVYCDKGKNIASLGAFKNDCAIWFFQGATITDKLGVLVNAQENKTKAMRSWRFLSVEGIHESDIKNYLQEAIQNERTGNIIKPSKKNNKPVVIPPELQIMFDNNQSLLHAYNSLRLSMQREYCDYIDTAKQAATKERRINKIKPMIISGIGLNDKYKM